MFAILAENDVSQWSDETGVVYHFPKRYKGLLQSGTKVIYYKGRVKDKVFLETRLSPQAHYFGVAVIADVYPDESSSKGDLYASIHAYQSFELPVLAKNDKGYLECIPGNRLTNYWRDGVRSISSDIYHLIVGSAKLKSHEISDLSQMRVLGEYESREEGKPSQIYTTRYERDLKLRQQAIAIHGVTCKGCGFNFENKYGEYAKGIIHIHHIFPISELHGSRQVDPAKDLIPLCPNCHAVVHRKKNNTLTIKELIDLLGK